MAARSFSLNKQLFNPALYKRVHAVWFEGLPSGATAPPQQLAKKWFGAGSVTDKEAFDSACHSNFHDALKSIGPDKYSLPAATNYENEKGQADSIAAPLLPEIKANSDQDGGEASATALALILLLDQMSRNIFRSNQAAIYSHYDRLSRALLRCVLNGQPRLDLHPQYRLSPAHRMWFYMPLMHSEHVEDHKLLKELLSSFKSELEQESDQGAVHYVEMSLGFEEKHFNIIQRFGRYPYRNDALGRDTTQDERDWIEAGGETFGTKSKA